jgi:hypothetical protein
VSYYRFRAYNNSDMNPPPSVNDESSFYAKEQSYQPKDYLDARCALREALRAFLGKCRDDRRKLLASDGTLIGITEEWLVAVDQIHHQLSVNNTSVPMTYYDESVNGRSVIKSKPFVHGGSFYIQNHRWRASVEKVETPFVKLRQALPDFPTSSFRFLAEWNVVQEKFDRWSAIASYYKKELSKEDEEDRITARIATSATSREQSKASTFLPTSSGAMFSSGITRTLRSTKPS